MIQLAQHVLLRDENVFKDQFAGVRAAHAQFIELARAGEAFGCAVDDEGCDAFRAFFRFCLCVYNNVVGVWALKCFLATSSVESLGISGAHIRNPHFRPIKQIPTIHSLRRGLHTDDIRAS